MSMRYPAGFISAFFNPLKNPDAPTIGTATGASVTFTAPANTGGSAITAYFAIATDSSSGAQFTGTSASSPITVSGLTVGNTYTYRVYAVNSYGPSALSAASNSTVATLVIGQAYAGGYYAGQISTAGNSIADFNLVVGPRASAEATRQFSVTPVSDPTSVINGPANSATMNNSNHPAAQFCEGLSVGGFSDWYLPAQNELEVCYFNLKPNGVSNFTGSGINANAVPARASNYTSGNPAQTSATIFQTSGGEDFLNGTYYWSSTQATTMYQFIQYFRTGQQYGGAGQPGYKGSSFQARAIRRVAV
jgi:hypothetical protein